MDVQRGIYFLTITQRIRTITLHAMNTEQLGDNLKTVTVKGSLGKLNI